MQPQRTQRRSPALALLAAALALGAAADAAAQQRRAAVAAQAEPAWYVGVSGGVASVKINSADYNQLSGATSSAFNPDTTHPMARVFGGFKLHKNWSLELGYGSFGSFGARREFSSPAGALDTQVKVSGFTFHVVGWLPVSESLSAFAKIGYLAATIKTDADVTVAGYSAPDLKRKEINLSYGLGLQYDLSRNWALRAEWEQMKNVGNKNDYGFESNLTVTSGSALYRF